MEPLCSSLVPWDCSDSAVLACIGRGPWSVSLAPVVILLETITTFTFQAATGYPQVRNLLEVPQEYLS
jgi:hypothetical protein